MPLVGKSLTLTTNSTEYDISAVCVIDSLTTPPTSQGLLEFVDCGTSSSITCQQINENWYRQTGCGKNTECDKVLVRCEGLHLCIAINLRHGQVPDTARKPKLACIVFISMVSRE